MLEVERLQRMFEIAGRSENFEYILAPGRHSYPVPIRKAAIRFLAKHLSPPGDAGGREILPEQLELRDNENIPLLPLEDLWVTSSGLIYAEHPEILRPNDVNREAFDALSRSVVPPERYAEKLAQLLRFDPVAAAQKPLYATQLSESSLAGGEVRYHSIVSEPGIELGGIVLAPPSPVGGAHLYLGDGGANAAVDRQEEAIEQLRRGEYVLFGDVRGRGAVEAAEINDHGRDGHYGTEQWFAVESDMMGRTVISQRTGDAVRWLAFLGRQGFPIERVHVHGEGQAGLAALFAAVLVGRPLTFGWENPLPDWDEVIHARDYDFARFNESVAVFGIARHFTMRELLESIGG